MLNKSGLVSRHSQPVGPGRVGLIADATRPPRGPVRPPGSSGTSPNVNVFSRRRTECAANGERPFDLSRAMVARLHRRSGDVSAGHWLAGTRFDSVRGESLRGFKSLSFRHPNRFAQSDSYSDKENAAGSVDRLPSVVESLLDVELGEQVFVSLTLGVCVASEPSELW